MKKYLMIVGLFLISHLTFAQQDLSLKINDEGFKKYDSIRPLKIGDKVPDIEFDNVINYKSSKVRLSDFKGKLVILDFWSRYCTSCIASFPKMQSLQNKFNDSLQILLVTHNSHEEIEQLLKSSRLLKNLTLPIIVNDKYLTKLFSYSAVPYQVFLSKDKVVMTMGYGNITTLDKVENLVSGKQLRMPIQIDDGTIETQKSMIVANNGKYINNVLYYKKQTLKEDLVPLFGGRIDQTIDTTYPYYTAIIGKLYGLALPSSEAIVDKKNNETKGIRYFGTPSYLFRKCFEINPQTKIIPDEVNRPYFLNPADLKDDEKLLWYSDNVFYYEAVLEEFTPEKLKSVMQQDLCNFLKVKATIDTIKMPTITLRCNNCMYLLDKKQKKRLLKHTNTQDNQIYNDITFSDFVNMLKTKYKTNYYFEDKSGVDPKKMINIILTADLGNIELLNKDLRKYGLELSITGEFQEVLMINTRTN